MYVGLGTEEPNLGLISPIHVLINKSYFISISWVYDSLEIEAVDIVERSEIIY